jgi:hypothetical protein
LENPLGDCLRNDIDPSDDAFVFQIFRRYHFPAYGRAKGTELAAVVWRADLSRHILHCAEHAITGIYPGFFIGRNSRNYSFAADQSEMEDQPAHDRHRRTLRRYCGSDAGKRCGKSAAAGRNIFSRRLARYRAALFKCAHPIADPGRISHRIFRAVSFVVCNVKVIVKRHIVKKWGRSGGVGRKRDEVGTWDEKGRSGDVGKRGRGGDVTKNARKKLYNRTIVEIEVKN